MDISYYKKYEPIFGSWHIVSEIGEGSFGKVFEIEREDFGYTYKAALKAITIPQNKAEIETVLDDGMNEESATAYFRGFVSELVDEIRLMSRLKGESNVVSYEDHYVAEHKDGIGWDVLIRMELLTPLIKHTRAHVLDRNAVINLGIDVCKALELCRRHNIIHRDIKPENIFVSENGQFKLGDFGIAKTVEKTTGGLSKKGTYTYMAPEVYKGEKYGPSVDIYSLGIVLYRYLNNNRAPFLPEYPKTITYTDKTEAIDRRINGEEIPAPANADEELAKIILKACAYDPKDRYANPVEMRLALESLVGMPAISVPVVEKKAAPISEAETLRDTETESDDKTVSVFGAVEKKEVIENSPEAEITEIENTASEETVVDAKEDTDKTVSVKAEAKEQIQPKAEKTKKPKKKKKTIIGIIAAALALVIAFFVLRSPTDIIATSVGTSHTVGLKSNGKVIATGNNAYGQCDVGDWTDIIAVSAGDSHTVGLKSDGTVVATGRNANGRCRVGDWADITAVSAGSFHTVGLKSDGMVVATGGNYYGPCDMDNWRDIIAVTAGAYHTVGLKSDGTVVAVGKNDDNQCDVGDWTDIIAVSAGSFHTVGLKSDGTVVATGRNANGRCRVGDWADITAVSAGGAHTVGLRSDGTVVATGFNDFGQCGVGRWSDIISVSAGGNHTVGLKSDGTVVATGYSNCGQCDVEKLK